MVHLIKLLLPGRLCKQAALFYAHSSITAHKIVQESYQERQGPNMSEYERAVEKARQLAQTPEGTQLLRQLQQTAGADVQQALDAAAAGDMEQTKRILTQLMKSSQGQQLLKLLGGSYGK